MCLIVRDEAEQLEACIQSARDAVDEVVVVDTGSTDDSADIARALGARVSHFTWCDSFSAARNASLDAARGDFVLLLDADERLDEGAAAHVRRLVAAEAASAAPTLYLPLIVNVDAAGAHLGADRMPRLWRNRPELRFVGRIHERVGVGVERLCMAYEDVFRVVHLGYDPGIAARRGKRARNRALLELDLADHPDDPTLHFYLAKEHYAAGEDAAALQGFERVIARCDALNLALASHVFAGECLRALGRPEEARTLARSGLAAHAGYSALWYVAGQAALDLDLAEEAVDAFERAKRPASGVAAVAFCDPSVVEWRADLGRARALLLAGEVGAGVELLGDLPAGGVAEGLPVVLAVAEALAGHGDPAGAAATLQVARDLAARR